MLRMPLRTISISDDGTGLNADSGYFSDDDKNNREPLGEEGNNMEPPGRARQRYQPQQTKDDEHEAEDNEVNFLEEEPNEATDREGSDSPSVSPSESSSGQHDNKIKIKEQDDDHVQEMMLIASKDVNQEEDIHAPNHENFDHYHDEQEAITTAAPVAVISIRSFSGDAAMSANASATFKSNTKVASTSGDKSETNSASAKSETVLVGSKKPPGSAEETTSTSSSQRRRKTTRNNYNGHGDRNRKRSPSPIPPGRNNKTSQSNTTKFNNPNSNDSLKSPERSNLEQEETKGKNNELIDKAAEDDDDDSKRMQAVVKPNHNEQSNCSLDHKQQEGAGEIFGGKAADDSLTVINNNHRRGPSRPIRKASLIADTSQKACVAMSCVSMGTEGSEHDVINNSGGTFIDTNGNCSNYEDRPSAETAITDTADDAKTDTDGNNIFNHPHQRHSSPNLRTETVTTSTANSNGQSQRSQDRGSEANLVLDSVSLKPTQQAPSRNRVSRLNFREANVPTIHPSLDNGLQAIRNELEKQPSHFWKGLLVGVYFCQAVFVCVWAATSSIGTGSSSGLAMIIWRLIVSVFLGSTFAIIGSIALLFDRSLRKEMTQQTNSHIGKTEQSENLGTVTNIGNSAVSEGSGRSEQQQPCSRHQSSSRDLQHRPTRSGAASPQSSNQTRADARSVAETAPSTASTGEEGRRQQLDDDIPSQVMGNDADECNSLADDNPEPQEAADDGRVLPAGNTKRDGRVSISLESSGRSVVFDVPRSKKKNHHRIHDDNSELSYSEEAGQDTFVSTSLNSSPSKARQQQQALADFYPEVTVLFATICGFAAWSSAREPAHVFQLLSRLHERFEEAAQRLKVVQVDTNSDSYMAVAGLQESPKGHALSMVKFAKQILQNMSNIVNALEATLGPDTGELRLKIGVHSGSVTAGLLGNRFQVIGADFVRTIQESGQRNRIHVSQTTADLLCKAGKKAWIRERDDYSIKTPDGSNMKTYWVAMTNPLSGRGNSAAYQSQRSATSLRSVHSASSSVALKGLNTDHSPKKPQRRQVWGEGEDNFILALPPMSRNAKNKRLSGWVVKVLSRQVQKIAMHRSNKQESRLEIDDELIARVANTSIPLEGVVDVIEQAKLDLCDRSVFCGSSMSSGHSPNSALETKVAQQLRALVSKVSCLHKEHPHTSFEHACHTLAAVDKLLNRCISLDEEDLDFVTGNNSNSSLRQYMSSVASDALSQFAILFAALVHDIGHEGISSRQLSRLFPEMSEKYKHESVAEQHSIDLAWSTLMDPAFKELRECLFTNEEGLHRFRQILVNCVLATDVVNEKAQSWRDIRWNKAFHLDQNLSDEEADLKATVVIECLVQAADMSHMMQHWEVYRKWNERLFREKCVAFEAGKSACNPPEHWYKEELEFFDKHAIPLAKKLSASGVFGVASDECLNYALENRKKWSETGDDLVVEMHDRYCKRKEMEIGGFTNEDIDNFTSSELEYIMKKLVEKGRNNGTNESDVEKGQNDAAQAWLDALEIYERCPAAAEISDRSIIFPIYSGVFVWLKGGKIMEDPDGFFEINLAKKFVQESKMHLDPVHCSRALAMLAEVRGRRGEYKSALKIFDKIVKIYKPEIHSIPIADVYGTDRSAQAFSMSALWHHQLGNDEDALAACEYVIQDLLPMMDPSNTLGNFELLYYIIRVLKPRGQEARMLELLNDYVITPFYQHYGPNGFTPCLGMFTPLSLLLEICADPAGFRRLDEAASWLSIKENGVSDEFLDRIFSKLCWSSNDLVAELCLRVANRLSMEDRAIDLQKALVRKGLALAKRADQHIRDREGNVVLPLAIDMHDPVLSALEMVAKHLGLSDAEVDSLPSTPSRILDVNLPPSYLKDPDSE